MSIGPDIDGFAPSPARLVDEQYERVDRGRRKLRYLISFLDDYLMGIAPHDLILLGAPSGQGKTDLALGIATSNAQQGKRVHYFALEAEPRELERRIKYALITREMYRTGHPDRDRMSYTGWIFGELEGICGSFNAYADQQILEKLATLQTFYRGAQFTAETLQRRVQEVHERSSLIIVDHLHYIDSDDENENRALGDAVKAIRDISLRIGVPIILVAHLRKRDQRAKQVVADLDDFHGSSNITKIATQVIAIERASNIEAEKWWQSPTFMSIPKDRRGGRCPYVALAMFDRRTRSYSNSYALGRVSGQQWEPIEIQERVAWAAHHETGAMPRQKGQP